MNIDLNRLTVVPSAHVGQVRCTGTALGKPHLAHGDLREEIFVLSFFLERDTFQRTPVSNVRYKPAIYRVKAMVGAGLC